MTAVSVVGLGKLGACLLAVMSSEHHVVGVDVSAGTVATLNRGEAPVVEPGLAELLAANRGRYEATTSMAAIVDTDATFVIVPTPSSAETHEFLNHAVTDAATSIGKAIQDKEAPHLVVIVSTVMPDSTLGPIAAALTAGAGRALGPDLRLCYSPEFIALGTVIADMRHPDLILIGQSDPAAGDQLEQLLRSVVVNDPPVHRLTIPEAELAKLCVNAYVTSKISFANQLAEICEAIRNVDAVRITEAIGDDSRIGRKYLQPATSFGGPCYPRDNEAFVALARRLHGVAPLAEGTIAVNDRQNDRLANIVEAVVRDRERGVGILGMAYKPGTPVLDGSVGVALAEEMSRRGHRVAVHDPLARAQLEKRFAADPRILVAEFAITALTLRDVIVVAQPCPEYLGWAGVLEARTVVDVWDLFHNPNFLRPGVYRWGRTPERQP